MATTSNERPGCRFERQGVFMKFVVNMVRKSFKAGEVIFDFGENSDDFYLIHSGSVVIVTYEGLVLETPKAGELYGDMASILGKLESAPFRGVVVPRHPLLRLEPGQRRAGLAVPDNCRRYNG